ncbi:MAG TPA: NADH-quinone oxidoreductase subunit C [Thermodesulfobacteriota bacterium]|nr:NADH-quinone oxidoreductase subunit C [Thermodesulfobacteriota bacterium]
MSQPVAASVQGILERLKAAFPDLREETALKEDLPCLIARREEIVAVMRALKEAGFDFLLDLTAVDYPARPQRFEVVYHLYSFAANQRLRVKTRTADGEPVPSMTALWPSANWLEREVYDLFGVLFEGHPNLTRIVMPDDWVGHPLRKDYPIGGENVQF